MVWNNSIIEIRRYYGLYNRGILNYFIIMKYPALLERLSDNDNREKLYIFLIVAGAIIFYLPYLSRQFVSDDWLWLSNAKRALTDPMVFFQRPMMGYFRPLNMVLIFLWLNIFGANAIIFSLINVLLHGLITFLIWNTLKKYGVSKELALTSSFIFAFYCLNASAIEWICVGHDLWVTALILIMIIKMKNFIQQPNLSRFAIIWSLGFSATLIKESGFISIGLYLLLFLLLHLSPIGKKYYKYTIFMIATYMLFCIFYFLTRTVADRQLVFGTEAIINLWYFTVYVAFPFPPRLIIDTPSQLIGILKAIRIILTFIYPLLLVIIFIRAKPIIRVFIILPSMFMSTIAIFQWGHGLFALYPGDTAARFMYSPAVGFSIILAFVWINLKTALHLRKYYKSYLFAIGILFLMLNGLAVSWLSGINKRNQQITNDVIYQLSLVQPALMKCDTITVITDDVQEATPVVFSDIRLQAIIYVKFDKKIRVVISELNDFHKENVAIKDKNYIAYWDSKKEKLYIPSN
jgi:hypothetical protein